MITLIVADGLDGAAHGALHAARVLGRRTAGYTPMGVLSWGHASTLGLVICPHDYTELNIIVANATVVFGDAPTTLRICAELEKPRLWLREFHNSPNTAAEFRLWVERNGFTSLHIAGTRESKARGIGAAVEQFLVDVLPLCQRYKKENL